MELGGVVPEEELTNLRFIGTECHLVALGKGSDRGARREK
jgi:hypothetical protein